MSNYKAVGRITGDPLTGLCDRMCIRADVVIDGCQSRRDGQTATLTLTDFTPDTTAPYTFVSAYASPATVFTVDETCPTGCNCCRVRGVMHIPLTVRYTDAAGVCGCAKGTINIARDFTLRIPQNTVNNYRFEGDAVVVCTTGAFLTDEVLSVNYCIVETYKSVIRADVLVPTYGYAVYPECEDCGDCRELLNSPLFPEN